MSKPTTAQKLHEAVTSIERATGEKLTHQELKELAAEMEAVRLTNKPTTGLCHVWNEGGFKFSQTKRIVAPLYETGDLPFKYFASDGSMWQNIQPLTRSEVIKFNKEIRAHQ